MFECYKFSKIKEIHLFKRQFKLKLQYMCHISSKTILCVSLNMNYLFLMIEIISKYIETGYNIQCIYEYLLNICTCTWVAYILLNGNTYI